MDRFFLQMKLVSFKEINRIAIPSMMAGIAEPLIGLADTAIIGKMPENATEALGAVGLGSQLFLILFWIFLQTETSLSSIIAGAIGKGREKNMEKLIGQGLMLNFSVGILLYFLSNFFIGFVMDLYQAEGLVRELAIEYYSIRSFGFPIALCTWMLWGAFRGIQNTSWAMFIGIGGGVVNLILDYILIYGINGLIEPLGVKGAAYGSLISQVLMLLMTIAVLYKMTPFKLVFTIKRHPLFSQLLGTSSNFILRAIALNAVLFIANSYCTGYGDEEIAAHTITMQFWLFSAFFLDGFALAGQAISGKLIGEKNWLAIQDLCQKLIKVSIVVSLIIMLAFSIGYFFVGSWFTNDEAVIRIFQTMMIYVVVFQIFNGIAFTYDGILKGILASKFIRNMMVISGIIFVIIVFILDLRELGYHSVWIGLSIWMISRVLMSNSYVNKRVQKEIENS